MSCPISRRPWARWPSCNSARRCSLEATLSFLGAGLPPTQLALGGMVRAGTDFLLGGAWWLAVLPAAALALLIGTLGWMADVLAKPGA